MKKLVIIVGIALALSGCETLSKFEKSYQVATGASVSPQLVLIAANSFDALEITATNYLRLPKCVTNGTLVCRNKTATAKIVPAIRSGRVARNNLEQFLKDNPGKLGPTGLYNALIAANNTLQTVFTQYKVGG